MGKKINFKLVPNPEKTGVRTMDLPEKIQVTKVRDIKHPGIIVDSDNNRYNVIDLIFESGKLSMVELENGVNRKFVTTFQLNAMLRRKGNALHEDFKDFVIAYE